MLGLIGKQGTGKSHLLYAAALELLAAKPADPREVMLSGWRAPFIGQWYRLADRLRYSDDSQGIRERLWSSPVVLLDEVRPTSGTNFDDTELAKFACNAYDEMTPVLLTSNVSPLAEVMGDAAASRFTQVHIDGRDARQERAA